MRTRTTVPALTILAALGDPSLLGGLAAFRNLQTWRRDAFTVAIGHQVGERIVVDVVRDWAAPFNPSGVVAEVERLDPGSAAAANDRGVALVHLARYGDAVEAFARAAARDPGGAVILRNLAIALRRLGRTAEADAALTRARALRPEELEPVWAEVTLPAGITLVYAVHPRLRQALEYTRAGRIDAAIAEYARVIAASPGLAPAHLGLSNELMRRRAADRVAQVRGGVSIQGLALEPAAPGTLFADWLRHPDGQWEPLEVTVPAPATPGDPGALDLEAAEHYRRALLLGAGAPAELGLALLARDAGRQAEAATRLAAARHADPSLPGFAPGSNGSAGHGQPATGSP